VKSGTTVKLPSQNFSRAVQVAFAWYFVENIFSKRCTFWSDLQDKCRHIFPQYICEWTICAVKMLRKSMTKKLFCSVTVAKRSFFCDTAFLFEQINHIRNTVHGHPQLSLKCRLLNRISFDVFDQSFCKVTMRAFEMLRSCAKRFGGLAVTTFPGASRSFHPALLAVLAKTPRLKRFFQQSF